MVGGVTAEAVVWGIETKRAVSFATTAGTVVEVKSRPVHTGHYFRTSAGRSRVQKEKEQQARVKKVHQPLNF